MTLTDEQRAEALKADWYKHIEKEPLDDDVNQRILFKFGHDAATERMQEKLDITNRINGSLLFKTKKAHDVLKTENAALRKTVNDCIGDLVDNEASQELKTDNVKLRDVIKIADQLLGNWKDSKRYIKAKQEAGLT